MHFARSQFLKAVKAKRRGLLEGLAHFEQEMAKSQEERSFS
jgi:hypothetical protein